MSLTEPSPPTPPLLRLSPELLDHILVLSLPPKPRPARLALSSLLRVCRTLAPLVRRHLYAKLSLVVAAPSGQDRKLVALLHKGIAGHLVRILKVRAPDPDPASALRPDADPVEALIPQPRMPQPEALAFVADALALMPNVRHVELDLRVAAWLEQDAASTNDSAAIDFGPLPAAGRHVARLEAAFSAWAPTLETCIVAVEDVQQRLQVWASPLLGRTPHVAALGAWDRLTALDLWRVRLVLTSSSAQDAAAGELPSEPTFRLKTLVLTQCELGSAHELRWLVGGASDASCPSPARSAGLTHLVLSEVAFAHHPRSSAPLLALFQGGSAPAAAAAREPGPPFARSLTDLTLLLEYPIGGAGDAGAITGAASPTPEGLLSPLHALRDVTLGGPGIDHALLSSLFPSPSASSSSTSYSHPSPSPSSLSSLSLQCLSHLSLPLPALLALLHPSRTPPRLRALTLHEAWHHPRRTPWAVLRATREPFWGALEGDEAWDAIGSALRGVARGRRRDAAAPVREGVRLWRNRAEVEYLGDDSEGDEEGEEGGGAAEDTSDAETDASAGSATPDPNALFVPPASDDGEEDENEVEWLARRRREAEEEVGPGGVAWDSDD